MLHSGKSLTLGNMISSEPDWLGDANEALAGGAGGVFIGRVWDPAVAGPSPVLVREGEVHDLSSAFATVRDLAEADDPAAAALGASGRSLGSAERIYRNTRSDRRASTEPWFLAPLDLQAIKAAGVTFAVSLIERVIEEQAGGDQARAADIRAEITDVVGGSLPGLRPGSAAAERVKEHLVAAGMWSQYLEVGIGPDAELFTKAQPLSAVGTGSQIGVLAASTWNNPEPEVVMVVSSTGRIIGATLGNDVNLRDVEGRSALLLGRAKDNNASTVIGPLVRLFDDGFDIEHVRRMRVSLHIDGDDGFALAAVSDLSEISRDPIDLVAQLLGAHHQYPDGAVLFLGTPFAPVAERDGGGHGFTHHQGDIVRISADELGVLVGRVSTSEACEPWTFGASALMRNLAGRGLL